MSQNYSETAASILKNIGGKENVSFLTHCVTRLRITLKDKNLANTSEIDKLGGVYGTKWANGQLQVILGNTVNEVYSEFCKLGGFEENEGIDENLDPTIEPSRKSFKDYIGTFLETLSSIISAFIPCIVACGLLQGLLYSAQAIGWLDASSDTYNFFFTCSNAAFYFMPVLIGFSAGKRFNCNPYLAATTCAILIHPTFSALAGTSIKLFGFIPITYANYSSTIVPAILIVYFQSFVEHACKKFVPKMIDIIVTPLITVLVSSIVGWMFLAPVGSWLGTFVAEAIVWLYNTLGPVGGAFGAAIYPFMLATGMQVSMVPIIAQNLAEFGYDFWYPINAASNAAMAACAIYIFVHSKGEKTKSLGLSTGITALIGVTEPVFFGLVAKYKKALYSVIIGGAAGGAIMALMKVKYLSFGFVPFGTIILAISDTFVWYLIGVFTAMIVSWICMKAFKWSEN
jgi:PTS system beta-glucosides-specific IIC component